MQSGLVTVFVAAVLVVVLLPALLVGYVVAAYVNLPERVSVLTGPLGVDRWDGLVPAVLFLAGFSWVSVVGSLPEKGQQGHLLAAGTALGMAVGLFGVALATGNLGRYRQARGGDVVGGTVEAVGESAAGPLSGEPCVAWGARVREHSSLFRRGAAPPAHVESGGVPFTVRDAVERVTVDPSGARLRVWSSLGGPGVDFVARSRDGPPERVVRFAADRGLGEGDDSRVYEEIRVEEGATVTVVGAADGAQPLVVPRPVERAREQLRRRVLAGPAGALLAVVSFVGLAAVGGAL